MYCRNCGSKASENAEYCIKCGWRLNRGIKHCQNCGIETSEHQEICVSCGVRLSKYSEPTRFNSIFDGDGSENYNFSHLDHYYQYEFMKINEDEEHYKGKFNWAAFLFGELWMLYKGMFISAIIYFIISIALLYFTFGIGSLVLSVVLGVRANYLYYNFYTKKQIKMF